MQNTAIIYNTNKLSHVKALPVLGGCLLLSAAVCVAQVLEIRPFYCYACLDIWCLLHGRVTKGSFSLFCCIFSRGALCSRCITAESHFYNCTSIMLRGFPSAEQNVFAALPDYPCCAPYGADISDQGHTT